MRTEACFPFTAQDETVSVNAGVRLRHQTETAPDRYGGFVKDQIRLMRCKADEADSAALRFNVPVVAFEGAIEGPGRGSRRVQKPELPLLFFQF